MITYRCDGATYQSDCLETAIRGGLARQSCYYEGELNRLQHAVNTLEEIVVALLAKLPTEEALQLVNCSLVSEDRT